MKNIGYHELGDRCCQSCAVNQRRCQRQCSQVLVDAYSAPAIRHGNGTRTGATRERGRQPPADGPKPTNRAYAREPRAAPQSHDSRVDCTPGCCDRGASPDLLPADEQIKPSRQCHLHAPANRARRPNPTTIARAETRTARQRRPPLGSYNATHGANASAPQVDHWQPRCLRHGLLQTARSPNPAHTHCPWHAAPGFTLLSSANPTWQGRTPTLGLPWSHRA